MWNGALFGIRQCYFWINPDDPWDYREVSQEEHMEMLRTNPSKRYEYIWSRTLYELGGHPHGLVTVKQTDIDRYKENELFLEALNRCGIENWQEFDRALATLENMKNDKNN
jgi:hypothetical protein